MARHRNSYIADSTRQIQAGDWIDFGLTKATVLEVKEYNGPYTAVYNVLLVLRHPTKPRTKIEQAYNDPVKRKKERLE